MLYPTELPGRQTNRIQGAIVCEAGGVVKSVMLQKATFANGQIAKEG